MKYAMLTVFCFILLTNTSAQNIGIGTNAPLEKLDVNGAIRMGTTQSANAGTIRWNAGRSDFEGFNGYQWVSLTGNQGQWGRQEIASNEDDGTHFQLELLNNQFGQQLGVSIGQDSGLLFIGADQDHIAPAANDAGRVYVIKRNSDGYWSSFPDHHIAAPTPVAGERFGFAIANHDNHLVVSAPYHSNAKGRVLGYAIDAAGNATYRQAFAANDGAFGDWFGYDLAMTDDVLFVSSPYKSQGGNISAGKVYVYKYNAGIDLWTFGQSIAAPDGQPNDNFGFKMTVDGGRAAISAPEKKINNNSVQGKVYIYNYVGSSWVLQQEITAPDGDAFDHFGHSLVMKGDTLLIGAPEHEFPEPDEAGKVYVYVWSGTQWNYQATLYPEVPEKGQAFGASLDYRDGYLLVGAPKYSRGVVGDAGMTYMYRNLGGNFRYQVALSSGIAGAGDEMGYRVMMTPGCAVVTSPFASVSNSANNGRVYYFYE